jgi:hypothetical protein
MLPPLLSLLLVKIIIIIQFSTEQFVNKLIYAREGAKDIMDRSCSDLPWHVSLEVDGKNVEIPEVTCYASFMYLHSPHSDLSSDELLIYMLFLIRTQKV